MIKMMTEGKYAHSEMAQARLSEGISVIFDQETPSSSASPPSSSISSRSPDSRRRPRARDTYRGHHRSSSSSSSSRSRSRPRSRSHPRCHRASSRCRCSSHRRYGRRHGHRRSPRRHDRAHSRSHSPSSSPDRSSHHRGHRSRSRSSSRRGSYRRFVGRYRCRFSQSPSRTLKTYRSRSRSRSSGRSAVSLTVDEKRELLRTAKINAIKIMGVEHLELPESVKPILEEQPVDSQPATPEPEEWVRPVTAPEKTPSQNGALELEEDVPSPKMSPKRNIISFSIHNSIAKPTVAAPSNAKVTSRVDSIGSRKPYGHWVPVRRTGQTSQSRKRALTTSR